MTRTHAGVDDAFAFALCVPFVHVGRTHFEFERGGNTVVHLIVLVFQILAMLMEINEARRHNEPVSVENCFSGKRRGRDGGDSSTLNSDVSNCIQAGVWIDYAATLNYDVVGLREERTTR